MDVCNLEDFKKAFFCLDELISREIQSGNRKILNLQRKIMRMY